MINQTLLIERTIAMSTTLILLAIVYSLLPYFHFAIIDDAWMLLGNKASHPDHFSISWFTEMFTDFNNAQYSPLVTLYFSLIYKINGFDPYYFHMGSLLLHFVNSLLLYILSKEILEAFDVKNYRIISYFTCLIWLVHPINMEAVVWISAVKFGLYCFFLFVSFIYYIRGLKKNDHLSFLISILFFILSCFSKEQAIVAPFFFIAFPLCHSFKKWYNGSLIWIFYSITLICISMIFLYITMIADNAVYRYASYYPILYRICFASYSLCTYVGKLIVPYSLKIYYPFPIAFDKPLPIIYYSYPGIFIILYSLLTYYFYRRKKLSFFIFCSLFFFINIGLCLQIIPMGVRTNMLAFRYMYLSEVSLIYIILSVFFEDISVKKIYILYLYIVIIASYSYFFLPDWLVLDIK